MKKIVLALTFVLVGSFMLAGCSKDEILNHYNNIVQSAGSIELTGKSSLQGEYDVEFVSSTEKFDTSTPMGRAMLNICIVFAQLERETIQKRVTDAYYSRCLKGFHMSGQAPYGYQLEPTVVEGIRTKKMVADPIAADHVRLMFEMYAEPETSFGDITRYFEEQGMVVKEIIVGTTCIL